MKSIFNFSNTTRTLALAFVFAALAVVAVPAHAQQHPAYLHALQDLRHARAHLDKLTPDDHLDNEQIHAIEEIDAAIREIKGAAIDDGKPLNDHPPIDAHITRTGRFHKALELLDKAHQDVKRDEDNAFAHGLQDRALRHIDEAHHTLDHIIQGL